MPANVVGISKLDTDGVVAASLDTLAAAYAEMNQFDHAVAVQRHALEAAVDDGALIESFSARLSAYEQAQPWRE